MDQALRTLVSLSGLTGEAELGKDREGITFRLVRNRPPALLLIPIRSGTFLGRADFIT